MFEQFGGGMDDLFAQMRAGNLMDLKVSRRKRRGWVLLRASRVRHAIHFANFNATMQDVMVFTHEMGHAFQWLLEPQPAVGRLPMANV